VIVFKFPGDAVQNYIKRLIGLPNETIRVVGGNIYAKGKDDADFTIARKPPHKLNVLLQLVDDTNFIPQELIDFGWPSRWQEALPAGAKPAWQPENGGRSFVTDGTADRDAWLLYRHLCRAKTGSRSSSKSCCRRMCSRGRASSSPISTHTTPITT
jgi:signal peptidase I